MSFKADRTDYLTYSAVAVLVLCMAIIMTGSAAERGRITPAETFDEIPGGGEEAVFLEKHLGHYPPVPDDIDNLASFVEEHPGNSRAFFHLGELFYRDGDLRRSTVNLRRALQISRDYVDPKSPYYQGEVLAEVVEKGLNIYRREKSLRPEDENVTKVIKDLYFIKRSMAGGCD